ncbi:MAG: hypothetical protein M5U26_10525 [Planctomycetota bacterium]|nr:hypothetical protein [Planctomycetota bacterium]
MATRMQRFEETKRPALAHPRLVLVTRSTEYERLIERHATPQQAAFFLSTRGQALEPIRADHEAFEQARRLVFGAAPHAWRRAQVKREDLDRFLFEPEDIVVVLGQDGLVANVSKYLDGQPVIGCNPDPRRNEGVLVPCPPQAAADLMRAAAAGRGRFEARTMVEARRDDGQALVALNEIYIGHRTHQSSRYELAFGEASERQSSSGLIVATGTGATGWVRSIARERASKTRLPGPAEPRLAFFVREAWPSVATGASITEGLLDEARTLMLTSRMEEEGCVFGDGIETDRLAFGWGRKVEVRVASRVLRLMR